jgi:hypothetical protein
MATKSNLKHFKTRRIGSQIHTGGKFSEKLVNQNANVVIIDAHRGGGGEVGGG